MSGSALGNRLRSYGQFIVAVLYFFLARELAGRGSLGLTTEETVRWAPLIEQMLLVFLLLLGYSGMGIAFNRQRHPLSAQGLPLCQGWTAEARTGLAVAQGWSPAQHRRHYMAAVRAQTGKEKAARKRPFHPDATRKRHAFLIFSSILKMPFGAPTNMRLKVLGRQRRSSVLRRVRLRDSAMVQFLGGGALLRKCLGGLPADA